MPKYNEESKKTLSAKQETAIELLITQPDMPLSLVAKNSGVTHKTLCEWRYRNETFRQEFQRRLKEKWEDAESLAVDTMITLCKTGDFKAAKYILDSQGYEATKKVEVKGEISNPMAELTIEELRKLAAE